MPEPEDTAVEREITLQVDADRVWRALTDPDAVAAWFGAHVDWDLTPGGRARFVEADGSVRFGVVRAVVPGRELRFVWWPAGAVHEGASEVTYRLAPDPAGGGTRLVVTEQPVRLDRTEARTSATDPASEWTDWDGRLVGIWGEMRARALAHAGPDAR